MHISRPESGVMLTTGIVGAGLPVAVGLASAAKRKGLDRVTVVSFGDGATNTGSFHEAANLAAVWDLPVVLVCQNNQYGEMTPVDHTMKIEEIAAACARIRHAGRPRRRQRPARRRCRVERRGGARLGTAAGRRCWSA